MGAGPGGCHRDHYTLEEVIVFEWSVLLFGHWLSINIAVLGSVGKKLALVMLVNCVCSGTSRLRGRSWRRSCLRSTRSQHCSSARQQCYQRETHHTCTHYTHYTHTHTHTCTHTHTHTCTHTHTHTHTRTHTTSTILLYTLIAVCLLTQ